MRAIDAIRWALQLTEHGTAELVWDMSDAPLTQPTVRDGNPVGNHPLWILGHLAYLEGNIPRIILGDEGPRNPVENWAPLVAGTEPKADASVYPPFEEVLRTFRELRAETLRLLERVGEEGLDRKPKAIPPGFEDAMSTVGRTFLLLALHQMLHQGQIADARRAAGRKPML